MYYDENPDRPPIMENLTDMKKGKLEKFEVIEDNETISCKYNEI